MVNTNTENTHKTSNTRIELCETTPPTHTPWYKVWTGNGGDTPTLIHFVTQTLSAFSLGNDGGGGDGDGSGDDDNGNTMWLLGFQCIPRYRH